MRLGRQQRLRRVGPAWVVPDSAGGWKPRKGRVPDDHFDEKRATVRMAAMIDEDAVRVAAEEQAKRERRERPVSFREVAAAWLEWLAEVKGAKPRWRCSGATSTSRAGGSSSSAR